MLLFILKTKNYKIYPYSWSFHILIQVKILTNVGSPYDGLHRFKPGLDKELLNQRSIHYLVHLLAAGAYGAHSFQMYQDAGPATSH